MNKKDPRSSSQSAVGVITVCRKTSNPTARSPSFLICCQVTVTSQSPWCIISSQLWGDVAHTHPFLVTTLRCVCLLQRTMNCKLLVHSQARPLHILFSWHVIKKRNLLWASWQLWFRSYGDVFQFSFSQISSVLILPWQMTNRPWNKHCTEKRQAAFTILSAFNFL